MSDRSGSSPSGALRIVRVIARLNIGGPAIQAITLTQRLEQHGYTTTLVRGTEERDEGSMDELAAKLGVRPVLISALRRNPGRHDLVALWSLVHIIRTKRPHIVHTHAAKGGTVGRLAAVIAFPRRSRRPVIVHTYHGHSLKGYFSTRANAVYRGIERLLARVSDLLIAVSPEVQDDLVTLGVAPASKFEVLRLGFDLSPFAAPDATRTHARRSLREELGIPLDARVVTLVARLVPIKRVDRFLRVAKALSDLPDVRFMIVGDGELRASLQSSPEATALGERVSWAGFRQDMPSVYFASDVVIQTSDNEGTPVALIEAQAAGVPVVSTRVGGAATALVGRSCLAEVDDEAAFTQSVRSLLSVTAPRLDSEARAETQSRFDLDALVTNLDSLYRRLLGASAVGA